MRRITALIALMLAAANACSPSTTSPTESPTVPPPVNLAGPLLPPPPPPPPPGDRFGCNLAGDKPQLILQSGLVVITAGIWTTCRADVAMATYNVHIQLEEHHGAEWRIADPLVLAGTIHAGEQDCHELPAGGRPVPCRIWYLGCHQGAFRMTGQIDWVSASDHGVIEFPPTTPLDVRAVDCTPARTP